MDYTKEDIMKLGEKVPNFVLKDHEGNEVTNESLRGKRVLVSLHPLAFTSVCTDQMRALEANYDRIIDKGVDEILGFSVDAQPAKAAWHKVLSMDKVVFVSDFEPKGEASKAWDLYEEKLGASTRANFVMDKEGNLEFLEKHELSKLPDIEEIIEKL